MAGEEIPVWHPEDLIPLKLDVGGPQDLLDVRELLSVSPPQLDATRLKESATQLRLGRVLEKSLRDIRMKLHDQRGNHSARVARIEPVRNRQISFPDYV